MDCCPTGVLGVRPVARAEGKLAADPHRAGGSVTPGGGSHPRLPRSVASFSLSGPVSGL